MSIKPLYDHVVIKKDEVNEMSEGGIILTGDSVEQPNQGYVVAVGDGEVQDNGDVKPIEIAVGNRVVFSQLAGYEIKVNDSELWIMREKDVFGIIPTE
jgi:chaperonin GroES